MCENALWKIVLYSLPPNFFGCIFEEEVNELKICLFLVVLKLDGDKNDAYRWIYKPKELCVRSLSIFSIFWFGTLQVSSFLPDGDFLVEFYQ